MIIQVEALRVFETLFLPSFSLYPTLFVSAPSQYVVHAMNFACSYTKQLLSTLGKRL